MKKKLLTLLVVVSMVLTAVVPAFAQDTGAMNNGIDVSKYQGQIDWSAVKGAGIQFAMIRTGFGGDPTDWDSETDQYFESNYAGATSEGIKVGAYHYSYATDAAAASDEADLCLHILNGRHLDYPVAYDVEDPSQDGVDPDTLGQIVQTFCSKLQQAGYQVVVYSYVNFYNAHLTSPAVSQYDTWIANYTQNSSPNFSGKYTMWQYTSSGSVPGISGACDMDYSYNDYAGGGSTVPANPATPVDSMAFSCDTSSYSFTTNSTYTYKITTLDTMPPTAASSNSSAVSVSGPKATYQGFLFTLTNVGAGTASITTTAADGRSVSFQAIGTGNASVPVTPTAPTCNSLRCDTSSYTFSPSATYYYYKIQTTDSSAPTAASSNPSAVSVSYSQKLSDGYLYRIQNVGKGSAVITTKSANGASASFTAVGTAASNSTALGGIASDTPSSLTMKAGSTYQFKFTGNSGVSYSFACMGNSVLKPAALKLINGSYYYKISAVGKGCVGIYASTASGKPQRVCVVTVK